MYKNLLCHFGYELIIKDVKSNTMNEIIKEDIYNNLSQFELNLSQSELPITKRK